MFTKFIEADLDCRSVEFPTEIRFIALIHGQCYTGEFKMCSGNIRRWGTQMLKFFVCDDGTKHAISEIERLWEITEKSNDLLVDEAIQKHNPIIRGTLPLTSYSGWYFVIPDYNDKTSLKLSIILPDILLKGLIGSNLSFGEKLSIDCGFRFNTVATTHFSEVGPIKAFFIQIPYSETMESTLTECLQRVNDISREINSYMAQSMSQNPLSWGDINLGFVTLKCCFGDTNWEGILIVYLPTEDGKYLKQNLRSSDVLFGQRLTHKWGELSNSYRYVKIPIYSPTKQGIECEKDKCITTIIDTFKRNIKLQDRIDFILFH